MADFAAGRPAARAHGLGLRLLHWPHWLRAAWLRLPWWRVATTGVKCTSRAWLLAPALLAALIGVPLVVVGVHVSALGTPEVRHLAQTVLARYVINTVALVAVVAALTALVGVTTAWFTTAFDFPGRRVLSWLLILPLALPTYIAAISYVGVFDFTGPLQLLFRRGFSIPVGNYPTLDLQTFAGLCFVLTVTVYPYAYLTSRAVFARQSAAVMEIARSHGYSGLQALRYAVLPLARPGIVAGMVLVAMETLGELWRLALLRRRYPDHRHLPRLVRPGERARGPESGGRAVAGGDVDHGAGSAGSAGAPAITRRAWCSARCPVSGCAAVPRRRPASPAPCRCCWASGCRWRNCSGGRCKAGVRVLDWQLFSYLGASVGLAATAALFILILGSADRLTPPGFAPAAWSARWRAGPLPAMPCRERCSPWESPPRTPGSITASSAPRACYSAYRPGLVITGTALALLAGYVVRFFAVGYHAVDSGFCGVTTRFDEVARAAGMRPRHALLRVGIPRPGVRR